MPPYISDPPAASTTPSSPPPTMSKTVGMAASPSSVTTSTETRLSVTTATILRSAITTPGKGSLDREITSSSTNSASKRTHFRESFNQVHEIPRYTTLLSSEEFQTVFYSRTELHALKSRAAVPDVLIFEEDNVVHESTVVLTPKDLRRCFYDHEDISAMMADAMRDAKTLRNKHDMAGVECMTKSGKVKQVLNRRLARSAVQRLQKDDDDEDEIAAAYTTACQDATKQALDRGRMHASVVSGESYDTDIIRMIQQERRKQDLLRKQERKAKKQQKKELEQQPQQEQQPEPALVVDFLPSDLPKEKKSKKSTPKSSSKQKKSKKNKKVNPTDDSEDDNDSVESSASSVFSFFSRSSRRSTKSSGTTRTSRGSRKSAGRSVTNSRKSRKGTMRR